MGIHSTSYRLRTYPSSIRYKAQQQLMRLPHQFTSLISINCDHPRWPPLLLLLHPKGFSHMHPTIFHLRLQLISLFRTTFPKPKSPNTHHSIHTVILQHTALTKVLIIIRPTMAPLYLFLLRLACLTALKVTKQPRQTRHQVSPQHTTYPLLTFAPNTVLMTLTKRSLLSSGTSLGTNGLSHWNQLSGG